MLDIAAIRVAFPEVTALEPLVQSGQKDVLRGHFGGEDIVLKLLRAPTPEAEARVLREIEAVRLLGSGYVPPILVSGRRPIGTQERTFIIERFMAGETYRDRLQRQPIQPLGDVLELADVLLRAVGDFEGAKLVHRDIKPENLIVGTDGRIWIIDFGIVRMLELESITSTGAPVGTFTPGYGAPEQMRNLKPQIDIRADLFSVGIVLYESLAGVNPHRAGAANQLEIMQRVDNQDLLPLVIPGDRGRVLSEFIMSMASRFRSRRPQTARQARAWFDEIRPTLTTH